MGYSRKVVLHSRTGPTAALDALVEEFIRDGVIYVGVVGLECALVEDIIDELVVGDGTRDYDLLTASHPNGSVEDAVAFARSLTQEFEGNDVQIVEL